LGVLLVLKLLQEIVEAREAVLPERAVAAGPGGNLLDGFGVEAARPPLRLAATDNQTGVFEDFEVPRDGRQADIERRLSIPQRPTSQIDSTTSAATCTTTMTIAGQRKLAFCVLW
jgi:hypothetical protein